jgi:hypothetical protein
MAGRTGKLDQGATKLEWRRSQIGITWSPDGATVLTAMQEREPQGWRLTDHRCQLIDSKKAEGGGIRM